MKDKTNILKRLGEKISFDLGLYLDRFPNPKKDRTGQIILQDYGGSIMDYTLNIEKKIKDYYREVGFRISEGKGADIVAERGNQKYWIMLFRDKSENSYNISIVKATI